MKRQNKLGTYLAVTAGVGCVVSASAATVVFYGVESANDTNPDPAGINFGFAISVYGSGQVVDRVYSTRSLFASNAAGDFFTRGTDLVAFGGPDYTAFTTFNDDGLSFGANEGSVNYANISLDGERGFEVDPVVYESVGQFFFDEKGGGHLIAIASNADGSALSISDGVAAINAAAVPEPSSLGLLALGAAGLVTRRNRKQAA